MEQQWPQLQQYEQQQCYQLQHQASALLACGNGSRHTSADLTFQDGRSGACVRTPFNDSVLRPLALKWEDHLPKDAKHLQKGGLAKIILGTLPPQER